MTTAPLQRSACRRHHRRLGQLRRPPPRRPRRRSDPRRAARRESALGHFRRSSTARASASRCATPTSAPSSSTQRRPRASSSCSTCSAAPICGSTVPGARAPRPARRGGGEYGTCRISSSCRSSRSVRPGPTRVPGERSRAVRPERHAVAEPDRRATAVAAARAHRLRRRWRDGGVPRAGRAVEPDGDGRRAALPAVAARGDGAGGRRRAAGRRAARSPGPASRTRRTGAPTASCASSCSCPATPKRCSPGSTRVVRAGRWTAPTRRRWPPSTQRFFAARDVASTVDEAQRRGIPLAPVLSLQAVLDAEPLREGRVFVDGEVHRQPTSGAAGRAVPGR